MPVLDAQGTKKKKKILIGHRGLFCKAMYSIAPNLKWLPTDSSLKKKEKNVHVTFTQAVLGKITEQCSAEGSSCCILSLCPVRALVCVCQDGAEIDRAVQSNAGP